MSAPKDLVDLLRIVGERTRHVEEQLGTIVCDMKNLQEFISTHPEMVPAHVSDIEMGHTLQLLRRVSSGYYAWLKNMTGEHLVELAGTFTVESKDEDPAKAVLLDNAIEGNSVSDLPCPHCGYEDPEGRPVWECPNCEEG